MIDVLLTTVKLIASIFPNLTFVAPVNPVPVIVTKLSVGPVVGRNEVMFVEGVQGVGSVYVTLIEIKLKTSLPLCTFFILKTSEVVDAGEIV